MSWEISMLLSVQRRMPAPRILPAATILSRAVEHAAACIATGFVAVAVPAGPAGGRR